MRDIGKNIRTARVRRGLTQEELAELLHVSRQTVSNYETGRSRPDVDMLVSAAEKLETDVQVLLYGEPVPAEERRERRRLLAEGAALLALGAALFLLERWTLRFQGRFYVTGPRCLTLILAVPLFWLLLGWALLHACGVFLGARPLGRRWARSLRRTALALLAVWVVLEAPAAAEAVRQIAYVLGREPGVESAYSGGPAYPRIWEQASFWALYYAAARFPAVFALLGGVLWGARPAQRSDAP